MKFTLGGLMARAKAAKIAPLAKPSAPKRAPMPAIAHGGAGTIKLKHSALSNIRFK